MTKAEEVAERGGETICVCERERVCVGEWERESMCGKRESVWEGERESVGESDAGGRTVGTQEAKDRGRDRGSNRRGKQPFLGRGGGW